MKYIKTFEEDRSIDFAKFKVGDYAKINFPHNHRHLDKVIITEVKHINDDRNNPLIYKIESVYGEDFGWFQKDKLIKLNQYEINRLKLKLDQKKYNL